MHTIPTDKQFTGQRLDATGLYYYGARYYDTTIGRFISPDTIVPDYKNPQHFNRYTYCLNNPLKYTDSSGHRTNTTSYDDPYADRNVDPGPLGDEDEDDSNQGQDEWDNAPLVAAGAAAGTLAADDITGIGVVDDVLIPGVIIGCGIWYIAVNWDNIWDAITFWDNDSAGEEEAEDQLQTDATSPQTPDPNDPNNRFTIDEKRTDHIFRNEEGHFSEDTPANRAALEECANNEDNFVEVRSNGNAVYRQTNPDGSETWAWVRGGKIVNGGINYQ